MYDKRIEIAPSILSASFASVLNALRDAEEAGAEYLHLDVMDGVFVPQITFGSKFIKDIRPYSDLLFDAHLMIVNPENHIDDFIDAGCNMITIHQESTVHLHRVLSHIKERGIRCGISIVPSTPVSAITPLLDMVDLVLVMTVNPGWAGQKLIPGCINKIVELKELREQGASKPIPKWLELDAENLTGKIAAMPQRDDIDLTIEEHLIVEFYSNAGTCNGEFQMIAVIQSVENASVSVGGSPVSSIEKGMLVYFGVEKGDDESILDKFLEKMMKLRIFKDENEKMNLSLMDIGGSALVVSQFTLYADCKKGNRPSFIAAGKPPVSEPLYEAFVHELIALGVEKVATGRFGADMQVYIQNDGPVTIILDTDEISPKRVAVRKLEKEGR